MVYRGPRKEYEEFAGRLRIALDASGMNQSQLARSLNISKSMVSNYLSTRSMPESDKVFFMAKILNVDPAWLFGADVNPDGSSISIAAKMSDEYLDISELDDDDKKYIRRMVELAKLKQR
ncbi:MAG: helix-turn-helix domain-containing protein [Saccharofermentanales bacterium]